MGGFRELENITADLGIEAWGRSVEEAFAAAAEGLFSLLSSPQGTDNPLIEEIRIKAPSLPSLLVRFLNEIIYLLETQDFLPRQVTSLTVRDNTLHATLAGARYDPSVSTLDAHVKAATYHGLAIEKEGGEVRIRVIFDV